MLLSPVPRQVRASVRMRGRQGAGGCVASNRGYGTPREGVDNLAPGQRRVTADNNNNIM